MKKRHWLALAVAFSFFCLYWSGCGVVGNKGLRKLKVEAKELIVPVSKNETSTSIANGANKFAFELSAILAKDVGEENFVCSPFSAWMSLAALANATNENSRSELLAAISAHGSSPKEVNETSSRLLYSLTTNNGNIFDDGPYNPLEIANVIFVKGGLSSKETLLKYLRTTTGAT